ncbi:MAG: hypothetical protein IBX69_02025 [Anaerolineales bacterium]|nr:hypothetical protein [Anaerolineales bacterium]
MRKLFYPLLVVMVLVLLSSCSGEESDEQFVEPTTTLAAATPDGNDVFSEDDPDSASEIQIESMVNYCLDCHTDRERLIESAKSDEDVIVENEAFGFGREAIPMEAWEKVLVDGDRFLETIHGKRACEDCHGGVQATDKEAAHEGMVRNPSVEPEPTCGLCHPDIVKDAHNSLHITLSGFLRSIEARSTHSTYPVLLEMFNGQCASCHSTCGDCHVSQPASVGGGFINGHLFYRTPSMTQNCTACHGSRIGAEYLGEHEGLVADVHFRQGEMSCVSCHSAAQMHGEPANCSSCHLGPESEQVPPKDHRYAGVQTPSCESCHASVSTGQDGIIMHQMHGSDLSCQVCHSIAYTNCEGCHVAISATTGNPFYTLQDSYLGFLIGRNPMQSYQRPYRFVPVRHVPIARDSFAIYGDNLLPNFDNLETWTYATPHNIQKNTPQNASCNACHGNAELFLTADRVGPDELEANRHVIIETVPPAITSAEQLP